MHCVYIIPVVYWSYPGKRSVGNACYFVACEFYKVAVMKGWAQRKYFFFAFFLTLIGYLLITALPDRGGAAAGSFDSRDLPEL